MKLQHKSSLLFFVIGVLTLITISTIYYFQSRNLALTNTQLSSLVIVEEYALRVEEHMEKDGHVTSTLANSPLIAQALTLSNSEYASLDKEEREQKISRLNKKWMGIKDVNNPFIQSYMTNPVATYLKKQQELFPNYYGEIFLTNNYGAIIATTKKLTTLAHAHKYWWKGSYYEGKGRLFFDDRGYDESVSGYVLGVVVPVKKGDEVIGILKCNIKILGPYSHLFNNFTKNKPGTLSLARSKGLIIFEKGIEPLSRKVPKLLIEKMNNQMINSLITTVDNTKQIISYAPVPITISSALYGFGGISNSVDQLKGNLGEGWFVVLSLDIQETVATSETLTKEIILIGIVFTLIMALCALFFGKRIAAPVIQLVELTKKVGAGDFKAEIEFSSKDELGNLATSFNKMITSLRETTTSRNKLLIEIKQRKQTEKELLLVQNKLAEAQQVAKIGSWDMNLVSQELDWSIETYRLFDSDPEKFTPSFDEFARQVHPGDFDTMQKRFNSALESDETPYHVQVQVINDTEREWVMEAHGKVRRDAEGKALSIFGTVQDITKRKRAETDLQESHSRLLTILNSLDATVYVADMETYEVLFANHLTLQSYGDVIGKICWQSLQEGQSGKCDFCTNKYLLDANGNPADVYLCEFQNTITGQWLSIRDRAITWIDGRIVRLEIATDITKQKQAEEELKKSYEELEKRVEDRTHELQKTHEMLLHSEKLAAIGGLSASIAHEFNNPLQGVMTVIKGVKRRASLDEDDVKLVEMAVNECNRMRDLIKSLQDFNRPSSGITAPMNIHATIDSLLLLSKKEYKTKAVTITTDYATDLPQIEAVADQLKQVVLNLLNNAAYACEGGGTITITTEAVNKDTIAIKIQDSGKGIELEHMDKIFEPFFTTKPATKGTGLGLSISYGIIKKHGGRIEVESELDTGTTFTITLPIAGVNNAKYVNSTG